MSVPGQPTLGELQVSAKASRNRTLFDSACQVDACSASRFTKPPCLRLTMEEETGSLEVTVRVAGILCSKVLPPIHGLWVSTTSTSGDPPTNEM